MPGFNLRPDADLEDYVEPATDEYGRVLDLPSALLHTQLSCARIKLGTWDEYGVRVLLNEKDSYASVHFRIPAGLPESLTRQLAAVSTQRIPYTDRDRAWDSVSGNAVTSSRELWNCFVDSVLDALNFAHSAVESAVWAHARGEDWTWSYTPPGRNDSKYERWGDDHPLTYDPSSDPDYAEFYSPSREAGAPTADDVQF